ncbi:MAG: flagellar protein [Acetatifactor sp.]|nr:flagellar protein [Acetatifactor sp.]
MDFFEGEKFHVPHMCEKCGGGMIYKGVGEYHCERCDTVIYDDYGKVRLYVEQHPGATIAETEAGTGVPHKVIRQLLREERLEVSANSRTFLSCRACGIPIRSGEFCIQCAAKQPKKTEDPRRMNMKRDMMGVGMNDAGEQQQGAKRFTRDK